MTNDSEESKEKKGEEEKKVEDKPKSEEKQKEAPKKEEKKMAPTVKKIVRIASTDLNGDFPVERAIRGIKGIGFSLSKAITKISGVEGKKLSDLKPEEKERLEAVIKEPSKAGIPKWMTNDNGDHYVSAQLDLKVKRDVDFMKMIKSYKGFRHQHGLPVRGQRTRGSFRKGAKVGVTKKKELPAQAGEKRGKK